MATHIQASALPATFPESEVFNLYASIHTVREVGGDFYDFFMIDENHLCFLIADATDEGAPAALYMMTSGASLIALALMTFFINARHIFYGISFVERFRKMGWRGVYMVLTLTDETYSILCSVQYEPGLDENRATFYIALLNHLYWIFGCLVGACAGRLLPFDMTGIDFSAATCALGFYLLLGKDYFLIPTLLACLIALLLLRRPIEAKEGREDA